MCFPDIYNVLSSTDYVCFQLANAVFLHSRQTKRLLRNNIAWGLYIKTKICLLAILHVYVRLSYSP